MNQGSHAKHPVLHGRTQGEIMKEMLEALEKAEEFLRDRTVSKQGIRQRERVLSQVSQAIRHAKSDLIW